MIKRLERSAHPNNADVRLPFTSAPYAFLTSWLRTAVIAAQALQQVPDIMFAPHVHFKGCVALLRNDLIRGC